MNYQDFEEYLHNHVIKNLLTDLKSFYPTLFSDERYEELMSQDRLVAIEPNRERLLRLDPTRVNETAHGGKVFGDDIIHFYPFPEGYEGELIVSNKDMQRIEQILVHECIHFFIDNPKLNSELEEYINNVVNIKTSASSFITEGIVDYLTINAMKKMYPEYLEGISAIGDDEIIVYSSNYYNNILFVEKLLETLSIEELSAMPLDEIVEKVGLENIVDNMSSIINKEDEFIQYIDVVSRLGSKISDRSEETMFRGLMNMIIKEEKENRYSLVEDLVKNSSLEIDQEEKVRQI